MRIHVTFLHQSVKRTKRILMTKRRILVPIDFSIQSDLALEYAGQVARRLNAMVSCIHVIEEQGLLADRNTSYESKHRLRREAENKLSERAHSILNMEDKIPFELIITSGKVHHKVLEKSIDLNAQIIVMGRSNSTQKRSQKVGSNAKKIVSISLVPVITVTGQRIDTRKHLILPLDLEAPYIDQLNWATDTALLLNASVSVITVIEKEMSSQRPVHLKKLKELSCLFSEKDIECNTHLLENQSTISREIITFSNRTEFGILMLLTRQKKNAASPYLGSIATEVLANTEIPVLFIHPKSQIRFSMNHAHQSNNPSNPSRIPLEDHFI